MSDELTQKAEAINAYQEAVKQLEDPKYLSQATMYAVIHGIQNIAMDMNKGYIPRRLSDLKLMVDTMLLFIEGIVPKTEQNNV